MRKQAIAQGATVEEARKAALEALALTEGQDAAAVTYEVLQEPQKKTFGLFGGAPAEVRATYEQTESPMEAAKTYLEEILAAMGAGDTRVTVTENGEERTCVFTLEGEDLGFIIGRRGDTLDALQYLVSLVANRAGGEYTRVTVDIGNYREKRERSLTGLGRKTGAQVARTGRKVSLEPMNPYERRIIHTAVQGINGVTSWSVGSEPNRYVIIGPTEDNKAAVRSRDKSRRKREEGRRDRRDRDTVTPPVHEIRKFVPRSNPLPSADGATPPSRTESETEQTATLYGRIDL